MAMGHTERELVEQASEAFAAKVAAYLRTLPAPMNCHGGYDDTKLTRLMRTEIAKAITDGMLPQGIKVSVRKNHYRSITVDIENWESGPVFVEAYAEHLMDQATTRWEPGHWDHDQTLIHLHGRTHGRKEYVRALNEALYVVHEIVDRHNYNNSRIEEDYFDVGYYLNVHANGLHGHAASGIAMEADPIYRALQIDAMEAAKTLGDACIKAVCGKRGVAACGKWALEDLVRIAKRANGRPVAYDKRRRGWFPVDPDAKPSEVPSWVRFKVMVNADPAVVGLAHAYTSDSDTEYSDLDVAKQRAIQIHHATGRHTRVYVSGKNYDTADFGVRPSGYRAKAYGAKTIAGVPVSRGMKNPPHVAPIGSAANFDVTRCDDVDGAV